MEIENIAKEMGEFKGEVKALREIYNKLAIDLTVSVKEIDQKVDELLLREAKREGEFNGVKKVSIVIAAVVSLLISACNIAVYAYVGG